MKTNPCGKGFLPQLDLSIVTYQAEGWLPDFFASLLAQQYPLKSIRLLIRDNGSTDSTVERLRQFFVQHGNSFAEFILDVGDNIGFGCGHNANLSKATSDYFLVSNVDLVFLPASLTELVSIAACDPDTVAGWECRQLPYEHPKLYHPATLETDWISCACALFRRTALQRIGGFEPRFFMYGEDVEISFRLRDHGYSLRYIPKAAVIHHAYRQAGEIKPTQILGNHIANALLRLRYGNWQQALVAPILLLARLALPQRCPGLRKKLFTNIPKFLLSARHFLTTRKCSAQNFSFLGWDYGPRREGVFYALSALPTRGNLPLVSILIRTVAGRSGKLKEAVQSVLNQTYPRIEIVVVEDGGSANRGLLAEIASRNPAIQVIYQALPKLGRCQAGNAALELAHGEYLCFLDDDDLLYADHVEVLFNKLCDQPDLVAAYALAFETRTQVISNEPWQYIEISHATPYRQHFSRGLLLIQNYLPIQSILFKRSLYEKCGGFDPELDNLEDWNLWVRYAMQGDFALVEKTTSLYRVPASSREANRRRSTFVQDYYQKAVAKNATAAGVMNVGQILELAQEIAAKQYVFKLPFSTLRKWSAKLPWLMWCHYPLRTVMILLRRWSQH